MWGRILFAGAIIALLLLPFVADVYILYLASVTAVYLIIALSLNLLLGYAGQISLGHAGFAAVGAYASAVLMKQTGLSFGVTAFFGACLAALVGLLVGLPALKVRGYYLALVTLAFGEIIQVILRQAKPITGGNDGLAVVAPQVPGWHSPVRRLRIIFCGRSPRFHCCWSAILYADVADALLRACGTAKLAAQAVGISLTRYKLYAFVISAFLAGLAGAMYSISQPVYSS